jgi:CRISPR-associated protein Csx1
MPKAVLQVLGNPKYYKSVKYVIDSRAYENKILAFAVKEWLKDAEVVFLVPESLVTLIESDLNKAVELFRDMNEFKDRIMELLGRSDVDIMIIPSVGVYSGNYTVKFEGSIENTIVYVFTELVKRGFDEIYADVSTGQNVYMTAMLEALRRYVTYRKLRRILQGEEGASLKLLYTPPVLKERLEYNVEIYDFEVNAFFSLPTLDTSAFCVNVDDRKMLNKKYGKFVKGELSKAVKLLRMSFNAILHNAPLAFYHDEILNFSIDVDGIERKLLEIFDDIDESRSIEVRDGCAEVRRIVLDSHNVINTFFATSLLSSIVEFWRSNVFGCKAELNGVVETFGRIYGNLGLSVNKRFLERDAESIKERCKELKEGEEKLLIDLYAIHGALRGSSDRKRNFFAHSGFLREITKVKKENCEVLLSYDFDAMKRLSIDIEKWLLSP